MQELFPAIFSRGGRSFVVGDNGRETKTLLLYIHSLVWWAWDFFSTEVISMTNGNKS